MKDPLNLWMRNDGIGNYQTKKVDNSSIYTDEINIDSIKNDKGHNWKTE